MTRTRCAAASVTKRLPSGPAAIALGNMNSADRRGPSLSPALPVPAKTTIRGAWLAGAAASAPTDETARIVKRTADAALLTMWSIYGRR